MSNVMLAKYLKIVGTGQQIAELARKLKNRFKWENIQRVLKLSNIRSVT